MRTVHRSIGGHIKKKNIHFESTKLIKAVVSSLPQLLHSAKCLALMND